jgi:RNA polymerase sigma-70 factor (ECF subfamily)
MAPHVASELIAASMENPAAEIQDFDTVVRLHWPRIYRFLLVSLRDRDLAETMTQDCFLKAYRSRDAFRGESNVYAWLMQIAVNLVRDFARSRRLQFWRRTQAASIDAHDISEWMPDAGRSPETKAVLRDQVEAIWRATDTLSERQRTVFFLRFVEDMSLLEIAETTGLSEGAVKVYLFRAVRAIRNRIGTVL